NKLIEMKKDLRQIDPCMETLSVLCQQTISDNKVILYNWIAEKGNVDKQTSATSSVPSNVTKPVREGQLYILTVHMNYCRMMPPAPQMKAHPSPLVDIFNNPAVTNKPISEKPKPSPEDGTFPRSMSVASGLNQMTKRKVKTIFPHTGNSKTLLSFAQGDIVTLLIPEEKDGWMYGEHEVTKIRGWFPTSYTKPLEENEREPFKVPSTTPSPAPIRSVSAGNLAEKSAVVLPEPDYLEPMSGNYSAPQSNSFPATLPKETSKPTSNGLMKHPFLSGENPFSTVKLRPTVTNDRSAPIIR
ncbi:hypothetical protein GDO86_019785, partial [Hymenochirus boettgeri]